jgi:transposase-like protein
MSQKSPRVFSREFKEVAVRRMLAGEKVKALAVELALWPKLLYAWKESFARGGVEALLPPGRPPNSAARAPGPRRPKRSRRRRQPSTAPPEGEAAEAQARIAELERKVGQQALELDFFARALRHVKASRSPSDGSGAAASSPSSRR